MTTTARDGDGFDELLEKSSLGGSAARRLRERTPLSRADTVGQIIDLRRRATLDGEPGADASPPQLPLEFEAFYLINQGFFHDFAEIHLGSRRTAEEVVHRVFLDILGTWQDLLQQDDLERGALAVLHRGVTERLDEDGRSPAFLVNGPIQHNLQAARGQLELHSSAGGLYEAILQLPASQFTVIVSRYLLGYPTQRIARFMGLGTATVDHHLRKGKERLRISLGLRRENAADGRTAAVIDDLLAHARIPTTHGDSTDSTR
ncbi:sigma-70 family RNA polymerase sigma factor [Streptomyces phaeofaciens]|uniref:sigma-70 family RNA polymerase sigma factor n=1 Tax=Streptomyces phaeofaciens TaxID=68254 RepID=UPI0036A4802B